MNIQRRIEKTIGSLAYRRARSIGGNVTITLSLISLTIGLFWLLRNDEHEFLIVGCFSAMTFYLAYQHAVMTVLSCTITSNFFPSTNTPETDVEKRFVEALGLVPRQYLRNVGFHLHDNAGHPLVAAIDGITIPLQCNHHVIVLEKNFLGNMSVEEIAVIIGHEAAHKNHADSFWELLQWLSVFTLGGALSAWFLLSAAQIVLYSLTLGNVDLHVGLAFVGIFAGLFAYQGYSQYANRIISWLRWEKEFAADAFAAHAVGQEAAEKLFTRFLLEKVRLTSNNRVIISDSLRVNQPGDTHPRIPLRLKAIWNFVP